MYTLNKNIKILITLPSFTPYGGVEKITDTISEAFCNQSIDVFIISKLNTRQKEEINGVNYLHFPNSHLDSDENLDYIKAIIQLNEIDILFNQGIYWEIVPLLLKVKSQTNIKFINVLHNSPDCFQNNFENDLKMDVSFIGKLKSTFSFLYKRRFNRLLKAKYSNLYDAADIFVLLSEGFKTSLNRIISSDLSKVRIVPNGFVQKNENIDELKYKKENRLLYVGRLVEQQKKIYRLLDIWEKIYPYFNEWTLDIVGDGTEKKDLLQEIEKRVIPRCNIFGHQDLLDPFYERSDFIMLVSDFEGFGMSLVEGMNFGCIPVSFDSYETVFDIINDGENGLIIPSFDLDIYAERLTSLMNDKTCMKKMREAAYFKSNQFEINNIARKWKKIFLDLLNDGK